MKTDLILKLEGLLKTHEVEVASTDIVKLCEYVELLCRWNKVYRLTAIEQPEAMLTQHILDSLLLLPYLPINVSKGLDFGSGAGFPGMPLAIVRPELQLELLDAKSKATNFLQYAVTSLKIQNVSVVNRRVEEHRVTSKFEVIFARAVSSVANVVQLTKHLADTRCCWLLQKGKYKTALAESIPAGYSCSPHVLGRGDFTRTLLVVGKQEEDNFEC